MCAQILDGRHLARQLRLAVKEHVATFVGHHGRAPGLSVVLVGDDPASQVYVAHKERAAREVGIHGQVIRLPKDSSERSVIDTVATLNADPRIDGILIQLPLPEQINAQQILSEVKPDKDVDGLTPFNLGRLVEGKPGLRPCTPSGCMRLLQETGISLTGKEALVIGRSRLVGKPMALMLLEANATVTLVHSKTTDLRAHCGRAEILVVGIGQPEAIPGEWIRPGAIVIDVGINRTASGALIGDVQFEEAQTRAAWITPVPGGVGPMTIAMLLENTLLAAQSH